MYHKVHLTRGHGVTVPVFTDPGCAVTSPRMLSYCSSDAQLLFLGCTVTVPWMGNYCPSDAFFCPGNAAGKKGEKFDFFLQMAICMIEREAFKRQSCFEFTLPLTC